MRSPCRWPILMIALACMTGFAVGCCPVLTPGQTPVEVSRDQRMRVRPLRGGAERTVLVPAGYIVVDRPPDLQPELRR